MTGSRDDLFSTYGAVIRRRRGPSIAIFSAALLVAVVLAFTLHPSYRATATILLEPASIPSDVVKTTVISYMDQRIEIVQERVMTLDTLRELVRQYDPYPDDRQSSPLQKAKRIAASVDVERVDPVTLKPLDQSNAFSLHYDNPDPERAAAVATRLANLFLTYNQRTRSEEAAQAAQFLGKQAENLDTHVRQLDARLSALRLKYGDALPESQERNRYEVDRLEADIAGLQREVVSDEQRVSFLSLQLSQLSPTLLSTRGDKVDLATLRAQLADAEQRYTPEHPDVKRLRRAIDAIAHHYGPGAGIPKADNPEYLRVDNQLEAARKELAAAETSEQTARARLNHYTEAVNSSPQAEKEYAELARQREVANTEYLSTQEKLRNAQTAETFESQNRGERFSLVRAPVAPTSPYSPNRIGLICLGLVLGGALAAAYMTIAEATDPSVRGSSDLKLSDSVPLLAAVPPLLSPSDGRRRAFKRGVIALAYAVAGVVVALVIVGAP
ncbi:MAG: GumC family protein [Steroidobacteraceae bacterium]